MRLETFFEKFEQFADAPDAVAKMRDLVRDLAVQGRLFGIAADDEAEGLPKDWHQRQLGEVAQFINGDRSKNYPSKSFRVDEGVPFINAGHLSNGDVDLTDMDYITPEHFDRLGGGKVQSGDVLYCLRGSLGKSAVVQSISRGAIASSLLIIRPSQQIVSRYIYLFLTSPLGARMIAKYDNGSAQPNLSAANVKKYIVPLPPLAEQRRIVAKVDELMALCDRLALQQQEREIRHAALARASLARFADAPTAANLNFLFHKSYTISPADLRKSILTLAVQGKLVEPDPTEEPVDDLLEQMQKLRQQLIDAKKIRKPRYLPPVVEDELPFSLPSAWRWTRWGQICDWITYGFTRPMAHVDTGPPIVTAKNVQDGFMVFENAHRADVTEFADLNPKDLPRKGDILITKDGTIGRAAIVETDEPFCINQSVAVLWLESCLLYRPFMLMVIHSPFAQGPIWEAAEGMAIKHLSITDFGRMILPLPPLAEQRRILAKVEQLMALVDALETQLAASRATAANILFALVAELTERQ